MPRNTADTPSAHMVFVERPAGERKLNILHQRYDRPDGSYYFREVGKITQAKLEQMNRDGELARVSGGR